MKQRHQYLREIARRGVYLALMLLVFAPGCVRRRMLIRSNPPGAMVYVDNQPIGMTPAATDFVYYGTRELRLVKPGFETLTVDQPIPAPWYQIPPLDFVSENMVPRKIQDYRTLSYNLVPQVIVPKAQILERGQQLRQHTQQGPVLPVTAIGPTLLPPQPPPTFTPESIPPGTLFSPPPGGQLLPPQ